MKRHKGLKLAIDNGFANITKADLKKINSKKQFYMRVLRWDHAMPQWPNYNLRDLGPWLKDNHITLKKMTTFYYKNYYLLFKQSGWEYDDLYNVLLWHAFIYLNTPTLKYQNSDKYVWMYVKQRANEITLILSKRKKYDALNNYCHPLYDISLNNNYNVYDMYLKNRIEQILNENKEFFDYNFTKKLVKTLKQMPSLEKQKKFLNQKLKKTRQTKYKDIIKLFLRLYE